MTEITNCNVCYETVQDAVLCPKCSKPFCRGCIADWLRHEHNNCPYCRTIVSGVDAFVKCYWMQDLLPVFEQLNEHLVQQQEQHQQSTRQKNDEYSKCTVHPNEYNYYYCMDCRKLACPLCMLLICGSEQHSIKISDVLRTENEQKIREQIQSLNNKLIDQKAYDQRIEQSIQSLEQARDQKKNQLQSLFDQILSGIDTRVQDKINKLQVNKNKIKVEIETSENKISEAENMFLSQTSETVRNDAQLISNQLALIHTCDQIINNEPIRIEYDPTTSQRMVALVANEQVKTIMPRLEQNRTLTREEINSIIENPQNLELVLNRAQRHQQTRNNSINNINDNTINLTPRAENPFKPRLTNRQQNSTQPSNLVSNQIANGNGLIVTQQRYNPETVRMRNQNQVQNEETSQSAYIRDHIHNSRSKTPLVRSSLTFQSSEFLRQGSSYIDQSQYDPMNLQLSSINDSSQDSSRLTNRESVICYQCKTTARDAVFCNQCSTPFCRVHISNMLKGHGNNYCPACRIPVFGKEDFFSH